MTLDATDRRLIQATETGLPLVREPYAALAAALGIDQAEVIARLERMLASGAIRRVGAIPNHYRLGFGANAMTVWDVPDEAVATLGHQVGALEFVSHCYRRPRYPPEWPYNLFAMVHGKSRDEVNAKIDQITELLGPACRAREVLYSTRLLKKTGLRIGRADHGRGHVPDQPLPERAARR